MIDSNGNIIKEDYKRIGDIPIILAECEAIRQAIIMAQKMNISKAIIHSDV